MCLWCKQNEMRHFLSPVTGGLGGMPFLHGDILFAFKYATGNAGVGVEVCINQLSQFSGSLGIAYTDQQIELLKEQMRTRLVQIDGISAQ